MGWSGLLETFFWKLFFFLGKSVHSLSSVTEVHSGVSNNSILCTNIYQLPYTPATSITSWEQLPQIPSFTSGILYIPHLYLPSQVYFSSPKIYLNHMGVYIPFESTVQGYSASTQSLYNLNLGRYFVHHFPHFYLVFYHYIHFNAILSSLQFNENRGDPRWLLILMEFDGRLNYCKDPGVIISRGTIW